MFRAGGPSWQIRVGASQHVLIALFVRDAAGLRPEAAVEVPPLDPPVELRAALAPLALPEASAQWSRWWEQELARQVLQGPERFLPELGHKYGPELSALIRACFDDAVRWSGSRKSEDADRAQALTPGREGDLVRVVEAELGRPARPFVLQVSELPVAGPFGLRLSETHLLVGRELRGDVAGYHRWLGPVIRELA